MSLVSALATLLLAQAAPSADKMTWVYLGVTAVLVVLIVVLVSYSGSKVRGTVAEPWRELCALMNTDLNLGFLFQGPIVYGNYRGVPIKVWTTGNLLVGTYKTHLSVQLPTEVAWQIYLFGQYVSEHMQRLYHLEDISREIPDFTGQLLYGGMSTQAAASLASPQLMQMLQAYPKGALKIGGQTLEFETTAILADAKAMLELFRWLLDLGKYAAQLR